ncbi:hypothetical protein L9F63_000232, partial [Diploptera punctata]
DSLDIALMSNLTFLMNLIVWHGHMFFNQIELVIYMIFCPMNVYMKYKYYNIYILLEYLNCISVNRFVF